MPPAIRIENLGKCYTVAQGDAPYATLRESISRAMTAPLRWLRRQSAGPAARPFWALKEVSFDVAPGETVGIIGRNGAGKSTLLKVLSRITKPTIGHARLRGRVGSLLEVGTGFHPELTGRENIFLNGSILGMTRREIARRFDEIVAFSEVEQFLDLPVKRYSSGMYTRLAFAVAAHLEPEILVIDEVLAVGDAEFQRKCLNKMGDVASQGRTVLFVSHNMGAVQNVCKTGVLLARGQVQTIGPARDVCAEYLKATDVLMCSSLSDRKDRQGDGRFRFESIRFLDAAGNPAQFGITGDDLYAQLQIAVANPEKGMGFPLDVSVNFRDYYGNRITEVGTHFTGSSPAHVEDAREITCKIPRLPLLHGQYRIDLWCGTAGETQDWVIDAAILRVEEGNYFRVKDARLPEPLKTGSVMIPQEWHAPPPRQHSEGKP